MDGSSGSTGKGALKVEITEVRVKLVNVKNDKLRAFCSITVDNDFVIRDLKVIEGAKALEAGK